MWVIIGNNIHAISIGISLVVNLNCKVYLLTRNQALCIPSANQITAINKYFSIVILFCEPALAQVNFTAYNMGFMQ